MTAAGIPALIEPIQNRLAEVGKAQNTRVDSTVLDGAVFRSQSDTARLLAAVKAVTELHVREVIAVHPGYGEEAWCPVCQEHWPCSTVSAVEAALRGEA